MHCTSAVMAIGRAVRGYRLSVILVMAMVLGVVGMPAMSAPDSAPAPEKKLRVVVKPAEPFSFEKDGEITGYSVELWKRVADEAGLPYEMKMVRTMPEALGALEKGEADVAVGAISITQDRERALDFTHPFFESGLQIVTTGQNTGSAFAAFGSLFRGDVFKVFGVFVLVIFIFSNILWLAERKKNPDEFPHPYRAGVWEACWWAACTIISGGCENKSASSVPGRLVAIVWMLGGIGLTSYITATLASAMTVNNLTSDVRNIGDLKGETIGTVAGSSAETFLKSQGFNPKTYPDYKAAIEQVNPKGLKAVVYDGPMLRYYLSTHADSSLQLAGDMFERQNYGLALQLGSPYRKRINEALLKLQLQGYSASLEKKWFSTGKTD